MSKRIQTVQANGMDFHCELRGSGPAVVLIPDGSNDCEPYDALASRLADRFTTLTFDMRGSTRSPDPDPGPVTPAKLADDVAGLIAALDLAPAGVYGCSSGGQAALALGRNHPAAVRNIVVHEAALQGDTPLPGAGFEYFQSLRSFTPHLGGGLRPIDILIGNADAVLSLSRECRQRIEQNAEFWAKYYLGCVDGDTYSAEDFQAMPPVQFTVGTWSPAWLVQANLETAKRGGCNVTWFNCAHRPDLTCPDQYAAFLRDAFDGHL